MTAPGIAAIAPLANACKKETDGSTADTDTTGGSGSSGSCTVSLTETEGAVGSGGDSVGGLV